MTHRDHPNSERLSQNPDEVGQQFEKAVDQEDAKAQHRLGYIYFRGEGVPKDHAKAVECFRKAAEQGHAGAQYSLGRRYFEGEGVPKDHVKAVEWFGKAAHQGFARAQYSLGRRYFGATVCQRTMPRLRGGSERPPIRVSPERNTNWESCI